MQRNWPAIGKRPRQIVGVDYHFHNPCRYEIRGLNWTLRGTNHRPEFGGRQGRGNFSDGKIQFGNQRRI